jgi:hypothetical protein
MTDSPAPALSTVRCEMVPSIVGVQRAAETDELRTRELCPARQILHNDPDPTTD